MPLIRGFSTESEAIQARRDEEVVIVLNGRPCVASKSFVERLQSDGALFQALRRGRETLMRVDFPPPPLDLGGDLPVTGNPSPAPT